MHIAGQVLSVIQYFVFWSSRFMQSKKRILLCDNTAKIIAIVSFLFLGNYNGIEGALFSAIRNIIGAKVIDKPRRIKMTVLLVFLSVMICTYLFDFNGASTAFIIGTNIINAYGAIMLSAQGLRIASLCGSVCYFCFLFFAGIYGAAVCELLTMLIIFVSILKYRNTAAEDPA